MANSLNRVQIIGNLTRDPDLKKTQADDDLAIISVATNRSYKDGSGEVKEATDYHDIVLWGRLAELAQKFLTKSKKVFIEGRLQNRSWQDKEGNKRFKVEIVATNVIMLDKKPPQDEMGGDLSI